MQNVQRIFALTDQVREDTQKKKETLCHKYVVYTIMRNNLKKELGALVG